MLSWLSAKGQIWDDVLSLMRDFELQAGFCHCEELKADLEASDWSIRETFPGNGLILV